MYHIWRLGHINWLYFVFLYCSWASFLQNQCVFQNKTPFITDVRKAINSIGPRWILKMKLSMVLNFKENISCNTIKYSLFMNVTLVSVKQVMLTHNHRFQSHINITHYLPIQVCVQCVHMATSCTKIPGLMTPCIEG